jgi:hypothetical protein
MKLGRPAGAVETQRLRSLLDQIAALGEIRFDDQEWERAVRRRAREDEIAEAERAAYIEAEQREFEAFFNSPHAPLGTAAYQPPPQTFEEAYAEFEARQDWIERVTKRTRRVHVVGYRERFCDYCHSRLPIVRSCVVFVRTYVFGNVCEECAWGAPGLLVTGQEMWLRYGRYWRSTRGRDPPPAPWRW